MINLPHYFQLARIASLYSDFEKRYKIGAVIVRNKSVISLGFNQCKTHPRYSNGEEFYSLHAEIASILKVQFQKLSGCSIYVYRETVNEIPGLSRPCKHCLPIIIESGISKIYYTIPEEPYFRMEKL
jgi:deoxycytidylate deaminase